MAFKREKDILEFPEVGKKLQAPTKQSVFEKQKQEAEAKRLREEAETAAVLQDFVKSFDDEDEPGTGSGGGFGGGFSGGPPKRHFGAPPGGPAGRGGFGGGMGGRGGVPTSGPGSLGPPPMGNKRKYDGFQPDPPGRRRDTERLGFGDYDEGPPPGRRAFDASDEEVERTGAGSKEPPVPKPTLRLANLPPGTSPAVIKSIIPSTLTIDAVRIIPPAGPTVTGERKSMSAIVTLSKETAANDIDSAVNSLQNRYLGYGFYLSLHRHLSSAALSSAPATSTTSGTSSQPFGAKPVHIDSGPAHAPPAPGRFAPPTSYASSGPGLPRNQQLIHVPVQAPRDIKELKLIHKTIESLLTHGPEFEALIMSRPEVQREEKWAWLWDSRSPGGVWYRWRLWQVLTGSETKRGRGKYLPLFEDSSAWKEPDLPLPYEYTTHLDEFVSDSEYNSSDEDESGDEGTRRRPTNRGGAPPDTSNLNNDDGTVYLNPLEKAKLTHLLARLPRSTGQLRKGDVARVTAFAISHAGRGADEVVAGIISNIEKPFAYTSANPERQGDKRDKVGSSDDDTPAATEAEEDLEDTSSSKLIGLYIVSDILSSSSTSGVRHAWRYRQLFESALRQRKVFEKLGRLEKVMKWGKLRAEKWKRSVSNVLSLWEGWCVFPQDAQDHFVKVFNEPPLSKAEEEELKEKEAAEAVKGKSKWKAVDTESVSTPASLPVLGGNEDVVKMDEDQKINDAVMDEDDEDDDEDVDGVPMEEDVYAGVSAEPMDEDERPPAPVEAELEKLETAQAQPEPVPPPGPRRRPRAVDMFADSGSEDD